MTATEFFAGFWWLIFPIMGFAMGGFGMFMRHRQSEKALEILKIYADQGKEPPPEVLRAVYGHDPHYPGGYGAPPPNAEAAQAPPSAPGSASGAQSGYGRGPGYDPGANYGGWGGPWAGGPWGGGPWGWGGWRAYRWGPFWAWRRVFIFTSLAIGFGVAALYEGVKDRDTEGFVIVTIIMGVLAIGALLTALFQHLWKPK